MAAQIADGLADAHAHGIVHGGIDPDVIIVTPKGNAKVLETGFVPWTTRGAAREHARSTASTLAATVAYMSPEQARGEPVDGRSDVFSLGMVLFEMLTGERMFWGGSSAEVADRIVTNPSREAAARNRAVPPQLDEVLAKALANNREHRYTSAAILAGELRAVGALLDARAIAPQPAAAPAAATPRVARRRRAPGAPIAAAVAAVAAAAVVVTPIGARVRAALTRTLHRTIGSPLRPVVAVLPFDASDTADRYVADGFTDDVVARLGQTPGLTIVGRSLTHQPVEQDPRESARQVGASALLRGAVRRTGDGLAESVALLDAADQRTVWSNRYTRDPSAVFAIHAALAEDVAQALGVKLQPTASNARASSRLVEPRAYDAYLRGREAWAAGRLDDARRQLETAIRLDDGLAEANAALAAVLSVPSDSIDSNGVSRRRRLRTAADRAFELAPDSPQASYAMALASDRLSDRLTYLKKSIGLDPSFADGFAQIGSDIADFDADRAVLFYRRALTLDALAPGIHRRIIGALAASGRLDAAHRELESAPAVLRAPWASGTRAALLLDARRYAEAIDVLSRDESVQHSPALALLYADALRAVGRAEEALTVVNRVVDNGGGCEPNATLAALMFEAKDKAAARPLIADAVQRATTADDDAGPAGRRCALESMAASGDAPAAAALLRRIAADDRLMREFGSDVGGATGARFLERNLYPWSRISDKRLVVEARGDLDRAYARERAVSGRLLADLTPADGDTPRPGSPDRRSRR
jgi:TolB-like protein